MEIPKKIDVVIIGGGATGLGISRDLSMRGIDNLLLERKDLACGATGGCHGLLHSGGRYAVSDPTSAHECISENQILRRIAAKCVEDTGGLFVTLKSDSLDYQRKLAEGCSQAGIKTELLSRKECLDLVPAITDNVHSALYVPDCAIDPFRLCQLNAFSSRKLGSIIGIHREVIGLEHDGQRIKKVNFFNHNTQENEAVECKIALIAAGAWSGKVAALAGAKTGVTCSKGSLLVLNHRFADIVLNRCRPPSDGDIIVPNEAVSIIGTTAITVEDPDHYNIEPEELKNLTAAGSELIPDFGNRRIIREYSGVRPLLGGLQSKGSDRSISRGFTIIDHEQEDGISGLFSIVGGKLTTYRLMAEKMADLICAQFDHPVACTTHEVPLEGQDRLKGFPLSKRLDGLDISRRKGEIVCECELVTDQEILAVARSLEAINLDDIRRRTRMGMGSCQGGYCTIRCLELLLKEGLIQGDDAITRLIAFLEHRYSGILPVLQGDMVREHQLIEAIYLSSLNLTASEKKDH
ncbi:anaerobic glycerol-3-phosphate dehydrogenase subunit GlpA [candidate division CSSED10-310 bacterium]|uniref:glycerol-3-phosphate dehydrogenase n=1 Tax=candidate division CSSED10-310 bacterium TaxID=2855610 RepID=A0ABV6YVU5_UNCC1